MRALGPIVAEYSVENAARDLLLPERGLIGLYLDEITYQEAALSVGLDPQVSDRATVESALDTANVTIDRVERPRTVRCRERVRKFAEDQLPAILLICPGTVGSLRRDGEGYYSGTWTLGVTALAQTADENLGRELAGILCAAASEVLIHNLATMDSRIVNVTLEATSRGDTDTDDARSRNAATRELHVGIDKIVWDYGVPSALDIPDPSTGQDPLDAGDLPTVQTTEVVVTPTEEIPA